MPFKSVASAANLLRLVSYFNVMFVSAPGCRSFIFTSFCDNLRFKASGPSLVKLWVVLLFDYLVLTFCCVNYTALIVGLGVCFGEHIGK